MTELRQRGTRWAHMADDEQIDLTKTEARGGSTPHIVRYVLAFSLLLVIAAFVVIVGVGVNAR